MTRLTLADLKELSVYCLRRPTLADGLDDKPTIKQFCDDLRAEMEYNHDCDVRQGIIIDPLRH